MKIHQLVHTLNYGDAISGEAITLQRVLQRKGCAGEIFSVHAHEKVMRNRVRWEEFHQRTGKGDGVILHYSIASPLNRLFLDLGEGYRRILLYHNLTPVSWFLSYNSRVAGDLVEAHSQLEQVARCGAELVADSTFNAEEIGAIAGKEVAVLPLPFDSQKWNISANGGIASHLRSHGGTNILHVGRLAPNKRIEDIIKAFYFYRQKIDRKSRLWLIGSDIDTEIYSFELRRLVADLRLQEAVTFCGAVADTELRAFYEQSDLYLCMSEHEGFCLPLLEAMYFGVPIVAFDSCAVAETLGDAGVLLREKAPAAVAELMHLILSDGELKSKLAAAGKERARGLGLEEFEARIEEVLLRSAEAPARRITGAAR